jgi:hypothetical protein
VPEDNVARGGSAAGDQDNDGSATRIAPSSAATEDQVAALAADPAWRKAVEALALPRDAARALRVRVLRARNWPRRGRKRTR